MEWSVHRVPPFDPRHQPDLDQTSSAPSTATRREPDHEPPPGVHRPPPAWHTDDGRPGPCRRCEAEGQDGESDDSHDHGPWADPTLKYLYTCKHVCPICNPPAMRRPAYYTADGKPGPCSMCVENGRGDNDSDDGHDHGPIPDPGNKYIHTCKHVCPLCNPPAQCRCRACTFEDEHGNVRGAPCLNTIKQGERFRYLCPECLEGHGPGPSYNTRPRDHRCHCRCRTYIERRRETQAEPKARHSYPWRNQQGNEVSPPSRRGC